MACLHRKRGGGGETTYFFFHSPQLKRQQSFCLQVFYVCLPKEHHRGPQFAWQFWMDQLWTSPRSPTLRPTDSLNVLYEAQIGYKSDWLGKKRGPSLNAEKVRISTKDLPVHCNNCKFTPRFMGPFPMPKVIHGFSVHKTPPNIPRKLVWTWAPVPGRPGGLWKIC